MDPISDALINIALNVASSGLTSLIAKSGKEIGKLIKGEKFLEEQHLRATALEPLLHKAISNVAEHGQWDASKGTEIVSLFLCTPEVEEVIRQVYSTKLAEESEIQSDLLSIRKLFLHLLIQYLSFYSSDLVPETEQLIRAASFLFDALVEECDLLLNKAIDKGILAAHEAKEVFRYNALYSHIEAIERELELLTAHQKIDRQAIQEFEKKYRKQVGQRHSHITPPNLESARPHPIDHLYVYPRFSAAKKRRELSETFKKDHFLSRIHRAVLLGNPGAGKSTLALKLCYDLANNYSQRMFAGRKELTPILVILRSYGTERKGRRCSIQEFIEVEAKTTYQLPLPPYGTFQYLLLTGRAMVIFDGLDELLDTSYRQEIRGDIESFCHLYPSVPVLVTSREVGYEQAPLDERMFEVFHLEDFDDEQVEEYAKKWFAVASTEYLTEKQRQTKAMSFLRESRIVPGLRSNPLMLSLLCSIYHEENYIPRYRPDVYEKCAVMLFERWDKSRSIYAPPLPEEYVRPLMEYLAYWIYESKELRAGVTERELAAKAAEYLHEWIYEHVHTAKRIAHEFIKFCTGRAWVFTDIGTNKDGENLYLFVHATFLEYFTAARLVHLSRNPQELLTTLVPKIAKQEWDVVAQLAFQLQSKQNVGAGDELLTSLGQQAWANTNEERGYLLSFAVRCLQFIVPRPKVRRYITEVSVDFCIAWGCELQEKRERGESSSKAFKNPIPVDIFNNFKRAIPDNCTTMVDTLKESLIQKIHSGRENEALMALEAATYLSRSRLDEEAPDTVWQRASAQILDASAEQIERFSPTSVLLCHQRLWKGQIRAYDCIKWHGIDSLFSSIDFIMFPGRGFVSTAGAVLISISNMLTDESKEDDGLVMPQKVFQDLNNTLLSCPTPWVERNIDPFIEHDLFLPAKINTLDPDMLFSAFVIIAIHLEQSVSSRKQLEKELKKRFSSKQQSYVDIYSVLSARFKPELRSTEQLKLDKFGFTVAQQDFIGSWVQEEITLAKVSA